MSQPETIRKIAVFTEVLMYSVRRGMAELLREFPDLELMVVEQRKTKTTRQLFRNQWRNLRRNGWRWIPYQSADILHRIGEKLHSSPPTLTSLPGTDCDEKTLREHPRVQWITHAKIHGEACLDEVRAFQADLGLSLAAPILKPSLFDIPRLGTINLHKGKLPEFRGMPPAFWEFYHDAKEFGCTVHWINAGLDTGDVLEADTIPRQEFSTVRGIQIGLDDLGVRLTNTAISKLRDGTATSTPQPDGGATHRKPTLGQEAELRRKLTRPSDDSSLRTAIKNSVFWSYVNLLRPVPRWLLGFQGKQRVIVLLYHRVSDEFRDRVTIGLEQFEQQMAWLSRHYPLVSMDDIAAGNFPRDTGRPLIAVTFDDGYLDNYENAVPILLQHQVPCTFFVSTGHMVAPPARKGKPQGFAHDLKKVGRALPTMDWDQLREMRDRGFTIGSHTVNHIDCGSVDDATLRVELMESRDTLAKELQLKEILFAYPFGRRENMTPDALEVVKEMGYTACCSAYGGLNGKPIDKFNILRIGINCNFTPLSFRARLEGYQ